ncbi:MAG: MMPL family transporter [Gammaproteobacteria bacterium]
MAAPLSAAALLRNFAGYLAFLLLVGVALALHVRQGLKVETDLLALLPAAEHDPAIELALKEVSTSLGSRVVFLVGAREFGDSRAAATEFAKALRESGAFGEVLLEIAEAGLTSHAVYGAYLPALASERHLQMLRAGEVRRLRQEAVRQLYAPLPLPLPLPAAEDPLGLANAFLLQRLPPIGNALPRDGVLALGGGDWQYVLVSAQLRGSSFAGAVQDRALAAIAQAESGARSAVAPRELRVLRAGLLFHSSAGRRQSQKEIELISIVSLVGVVTLVLLTFGSPRPLLLTMASLVVGTACGLTACLYLFGSLHLLTFVFGSTLIGVAVDYSNYFLHDAFDEPAGWTGARALRNTLRGILLGLGTSVLGYLALSLAPFPGLRQMAVFSAAGLLGAAGCVLCLHPVLARPPRNAQPPILRRVLSLYFALAGLRRTRWLGVAALVLVAAGALRLTAQDDIRLLQSSPAHLVAEEGELRALIGNPPDSRFFLVRGATPQEVLEAEEGLRPQLDAAVAQGAVASYLAISRALPSLKAQREARQLLARDVYGGSGALARMMGELGFDAAAIERRQRAFREVPADGLAPEHWLDSPAATPYRALWLALPQGHASLVMLSGVRDVAALRAVQAPGAVLVDKVAEVSDVLGRYRGAAMRLLVLAYAGAALLLAWRYGARRSLPLIAGMIGAAVVTLGVFGWAGLPVNLFSVLALLLVLGIGIDYVIFLQEGFGAGHGPLLAVMLSAVTTLLSFGLLAFSGTPFMHSIGLTLLLGIGLSFIFALLGANIRREAA